MEVILSIKKRFLSGPASIFVDLNTVLHTSRHQGADSVWKTYGPKWLTKILVFHVHGCGFPGRSNAKYSDYGFDQGWSRHILMDQCLLKEGRLKSNPLLTIFVHFSLSVLSWCFPLKTARLYTENSAAYASEKECGKLFGLCSDTRVG